MGIIASLTCLFASTQLAKPIAEGTANQEARQLYMSLCYQFVLYKTLIVNDLTDFWFVGNFQISMFTKMISRAELRRIATERLKDAELLLAAGRYDGACYLSGYVVEIGLKLRICKTLKWQGFPEMNSEFQGFQSLKTHDFNILLRFSGLEDKIKSSYLAEWSDLKPWKPELRYAIAGTASLKSASVMVDAAKTLLKIL